MKSHEGHDIFCDEYFFSVNKYDIPKSNGRITPKYTIVERYVDSKFRDIK